MGQGIYKPKNYEVEKWSKILADFEGCGQNIKEYCHRVGITPGSYYYYRRKMRDLVSDPLLLPIMFEKAEEKPALLKIHYHGATIEMIANDEISLCAVFSALKKV